MLFTDIVGSTRLKQILGDRTAIELIQRHHAGLRAILSRFPEAEEIGTAGDSFFIVFTKPSDATQFALLAQHVTRALGRESGTPLLDRIGIHVGEIFIQERDGKQRDLFGIQVDTTTRIMSLGGADQIVLSRFAFDNARQILHGFALPELGELAWLNHGYYEMKGVEEPVEVCEVGEKGLAALTPPGDSEKARRFHPADAEPVLGWRPSAGQVVPGTRWKLERLLGQGGFGEVWLAEHENLKQRRVLKFCFKAERARALKREATLFRVLRERFGEHPNIVAIHDVFFAEPPYYLVMDYVDGPSLDRWTGDQKSVAETPLATRLELVAQIADALQAAHESGIIHRDVKPSNVLVENYRDAPRARLVDFGIGHVVNPEALAGMTRFGFSQTMLYTGSGAGTPLYQAPELLVGQPATTRSDVYSLGVLLWQLVIGDFKKPLATDWTGQISDPLLREDIAQCVAGDPQIRFASTSELAARLRNLAARHRAWQEAEERRAELERRAYRRGVMRTAAVAMAVIVMVAGLALYAFRQAGIARKEKQRAETGEKTVGQLHRLMGAKAEDVKKAVEEMEQREWKDKSLRLNGVRKIVDQSLSALGCMNPSSAEFAVITTNGGVRLFDAQGNTAKEFSPPGRRFSAVAYSPDGKELLIGTKEGALLVWDVSKNTHETVRTNVGRTVDRVTWLGHDKLVWGCSVSYWTREGVPTNRDTPAGSVLARGGGQMLWQFRSFIRDDFYTLAGARDSHALAVIGIPGQVATSFLLDGTTGEVLQSFDDKEKRRGGLSVEISPDGNTLATGGGPSDLDLWDARTGKHRASLQGHDNWVVSLAFSADSKRLISGSGDATARIWDVVNGREIGRIRFLSDRSLYVDSVGLSPMGDMAFALAAGVMIVGQVPNSTDRR
jgi:class 3 adenylate cyclase/tRNA A-37 threonylcarbamoyl transferase component Bud32